MIKVLRLFAVCLLALGLALAAFAQPMEIPEGSHCYNCGMKVDPASPFAAEIVEAGKPLPFCDIGDMMHSYKKMAEKPGVLYVRDYASGEWTDALKAFYVKSDEFKTPMGWGFAAFREKGEAEKNGSPMTFEETLKLIP
jgi:nitrous oxide reductase accessory protein NosL